MASRANGKSAKRSSSYDRFKEFQGQRYTGMKVGRRHKWHYDQGEWTEKKVTPDRWEFRYSVVKRRAGRAPEGSGAPVGTAYRWYILADQVVTKQDANSYTTEMVGLKYKLAHKRADKESWSASEKAQRKRLAALLREMAEGLEAEPKQTVAADGAAKPPAQPAPAPRKTARRASAHGKRANGHRATAAVRPRVSGSRSRALRQARGA